MPNPKIEPLYTIKDVGYLLCFSRQTIWELVKRGELHPIKFKRAVRFSPAEIERFVKARTA